MGQYVLLRRCQRAQSTAAQVVVTRQQEAHQLLCEVFRCHAVDEAMRDSEHPCATIVRFQDRFEGPFQPPTPWVGQLDQAPILFVGSNPNIGGDEFYPDTAWPDDDLVDFFDYAFSGENLQIKDGVHARQANGGYGPFVRTWAGVRGRAKELLQRNPQPGLDYAMTEVVRCRSWTEIGVGEARGHCADLYLERTIALSPARVIVALGSHVRGWLRHRWHLGPEPVAEVRFDRTTRLVAFLPHPTSHVPKTFQSVMPEELERLRAAL